MNECAKKELKEHKQRCMKLTEELAQCKSRATKFEALYLNTKDELEKQKGIIDDINFKVRLMRPNGCDCRKILGPLAEAADKSIRVYFNKPCPESRVLKKY